MFKCVLSGIADVFCPAFAGTPVRFGLGRAWRQVALSNRSGRYNEKQKEEE
jgi:hypothetical protein